MGISIRVASPKLIMEEAPESFLTRTNPCSPHSASLHFRRLGYKDVTQVVQTCPGPEKPIFPQCLRLLRRDGGPSVPAGHDAGISKKAIKLKPVAVVKG